MTDTNLPPGPTPTATAARPWTGGFRPDIEGLRAVAVLAVLAYHARLGPTDGGYIGVDVFFVVSGFLITRLLLDEADRTGRISLPRFWARRARRLLPASALVIVATLIAARFMVDPITQGFVNRSGLAASGFAANILFWTRGGYTQVSLPEPLLHYWSLAVEEQFYLFWPLVVAAAVRFRRFRTVLITATAVIGAASLVACVLLTPDHQSFTFYWLPPRAWELLAGAGLALAGPLRTAARSKLAGASAWLGLAAIVAAIVVYTDPAGGFPGVRALLPVAATALVIVGGRSPWGPGTVLGLAPFQWVGSRSYAIYLWHFPFLVLAEAKWQLSASARAGVLGLSVVAAALSYALVENPIRRHQWLGARPHRGFALGGTLVGASLLTAGLLIGSASPLATGAAAATPTLVTLAPAPTVAAAATLATVVTPAPAATVSTTSPTADPVDAAPVPAVPEAGPTTTEVDVRDHGGPYPDNPRVLRDLAAANRPLLDQAVATDVVPSNLRPSLKKAYQDLPAVYRDKCILSDHRTTPGECTYGDAGSDTVIVLFGDSHAAQWFPAFEAAATARGWRLVVMTKKACPAGDIVIQRPGQTDECRTWRANVAKRLQALHPDLLVMSSFRYKGSEPPDWEVGLDATVAQMRPLVDRLLILGDTPTPTGDVPSCVAGNLGSLHRCNRERALAVKAPWLAVDVRVAARHDALTVTVGDWVCNQRVCPVVVGDVLLYRDETHLTATGSAFLAPYIDATVQWALAQ